MRFRNISRDDIRDNSINNINSIESINTISNINTKEDINMKIGKSNLKDIIKDFFSQRGIYRFIVFIVFTLLLYAIMFNLSNAQIWSSEDEAEYQKRLGESNNQLLQTAKEMAKIQTESQIQIEKAKLQAQKEANTQGGNESPIHSSKTNFLDSTVIKKKGSESTATKNIAKSKVPIQHKGVKNPPNYKIPTKSDGKELSKEEVMLLMNANQIQNLGNLQEAFFKSDFNPNSNLMEALEQKEHTIRIRTRYAMTTTIVFDFPIENYIVGDETGFQVEELPNMNNALNVRPLLVGIDTNLTVFTTDKRIYSLYLFSTNYAASKVPKLIVNVKTPYTKEEIQKEVELKDKQREKIDRNTYLVIEEGSERIKVKKDDIDRRYIQKAKKHSKYLLAQDIFSDKRFTFFKYDNELMPVIPAVWVVIDGKDAPIQSRVVGKYLIVESIADKFTLRIGEAYVCVSRKK